MGKQVWRVLDLAVRLVHGVRNVSGMFWKGGADHFDPTAESIEAEAVYTALTANLVAILEHSITASVESVRPGGGRGPVLTSSKSGMTRCSRFFLVAMIDRAATNQQLPISPEMK